MLLKVVNDWEFCWKLVKWDVYFYYYILKIFGVWNLCVLYKDLMCIFMYFIFEMYIFIRYVIIMFV